MTLADRRGFDADVYEPAEDSELLASVAVDRADSTDRIVDVGTGTGYVAARIRDATGAAVFGTELNPHACRRARGGTVPGGEPGNADGEAHDGQPLPVVRGNLTHPIADGVADLVTFNPPYLPTEPEAERDDWLAVALSGGETGRAAIEPFLDDVGRVLASNGTALLLASTLTDVDAVQALAADVGFEAPVVAEESFPFETLVVLELEPCT